MPAVIPPAPPVTIILLPSSIDVGMLFFLSLSARSARFRCHALGPTGGMLRRARSRGMSKVQSNTFRYLFTPSAHGVPPAPTHSEEIEYVFANLGARRLVVGTFDLDR